MQDDLLGDAVEQLLAGHCTPAVVRAIDAGASPAALWQAVEESGFCDALVPEAMAGSGLHLSDVGVVFEACGRHALPVPLAQTLMARAVLAQAGHRAAPGSIALGLQDASCGVADAVLVSAGGVLELRDARDTQRAPLFTARSGVDLLAVEAGLLAAMMAGAMRAIFDRTLQYANDRTQFGRSIGKFQAIQHQLSVMAEHTAAATMAARMACSGSGVVAAPLACAVAKARTSEAVVPVTAIAHAVHGAIGITEEYDLQLLTRRLQAWRVRAGAESYWNERIGRALLASDHDSLPEFVRLELSPTL